MKLEILAQLYESETKWKNTREVMERTIILTGASTDASYVLATIRLDVSRLDLSKLCGNPPKFKVTIESIE
jgi:hypothetical protein